MQLTQEIVDAGIYIHTSKTRFLIQIDSFDGEFIYTNDPIISNGCKVESSGASEPFMVVVAEPSGNAFFALTETEYEFYIELHPQRRFGGGQVFFVPMIRRTMPALCKYSGDLGQLLGK